MNKQYICERLIKLTKLLHGKDCKPYAKKKKNMYVFGSEKYDIKNVVSKPFAIFLVIGDIKQMKKELK